MLAPPVAMGREPPWWRLAQFVAAVLLALMFVAARRLRSRGPALWWWVALVSLGLALVAIFGYDHMTRAWSCLYDGSRVIVGSEYTSQGREQRQRDPDVTCERLIADFAGRTEDVWRGEGIRRRESILAAVYVGAVALFTICIVAVVEVIAVTSRPATARRPARR